MKALLLGRIGKESANTRKLTRCRRCAEPLPAPMGKECAEIGSAQIEQPSRPDQCTTIAAEEDDQPVGSRYIGANGVRRATAIVLEMSGPLRSKRLSRMN